MCHAEDSGQAPKMPEQSSPCANASVSPSTQQSIKEGSSGASKSEDYYAAFWPSWFQASITYRGRMEGPSGIGFAGNSEDFYYLSRIRIEAKLRVSRYINLFGMTQDARVYGYDNVTPRPSSMVDAVDLRQAYIDIHAESNDRKFSFRFGTQYLDMGSKRLVAVSSWGNATPVYDAAKISYSAQGISTSIFAATRVSTIKAYKFNEPKPGENIYGAYVSLDRLIRDAKVEPFLYWRTQPRVTDENGLKGDSDLATFGLRYLGKLPRRFDYSAELAFQRGTYAHDSVSAWAGTWSVGYTLSSSTKKPKLYFEYNYATGDKAKKDGIRGTFDQLYASNHANYGIADQIGWRNTSNYEVGFEFEPLKKTRLQLDLNDFYLATLRDSLYSDGGSAIVTNPKATSKHVGWEPDLQFTYAANRQLSIGAGFGRLNCGGFLKQSTQGHSYNYPYLTWEDRF